MYGILVFHESRKYPYYFPYLKIMIPVSFLAIVAIFIFAVIKNIHKTDKTKFINIRNMFIRGMAVSLVGLIPALYLVGFVETFVGNLF